MSKVKSGGSTRKTADSQGQRLGVKRSGGQKVRTGEVIVRQVGQTKIAGEGTFVSRNYTIHAARDGVVRFKKTKITRFTGKTARRTQVNVETI